MFKLVIEIKGQAWSVVNTKDIRQKCCFFCLAIAKDALVKLNCGEAHINDYM